MFIGNNRLLSVPKFNYIVFVENVSEMQNYCYDPYFFSALGIKCSHNSTAGKVFSFQSEGFKFETLTEVLSYFRS